MTLICDYCGTVPHRSGCPFGDGDEIKANKCSLCGCDTSDYLIANGDPVCRECIEGLDLYDLLELYEIGDITELVARLEEV